MPTAKSNKTELDHIVRVVEKLDTAIDKLTDVSSGLTIFCEIEGDKSQHFQRKGIPSLTTSC